MPTPALSDQLALQQLFQEPMAPLGTYGQGALQIALQDRQRRQQLQDQAAQQQFQLQRDQSQSALVMAREQEIEKMRLAAEEKAIDLHSQARLKEAKAEFEMKSQAAKKEERDRALAEARSIGIGKERLPDDADYSTILEETTKSRGRQLVAAAKTAASAINAYAQFKGETADAVAKRAMAKAIGSLAPKELKQAKITQDDINKVIQDPSKFSDLLTRAAKEKNVAGSAILNRVNAEYQQDIETGMAAAEKTNPRLTGLAERFKVASDDLKSLRTKGGYDEASGIESSKALLTDAFATPSAPQQPQARPRPPLPPPTTGVPVTGSTATPFDQSAPAPSGFPGVLPAIGGTLATAGRNLYQGGKILAAPIVSGFKDVNSALWGGPMENPLTALQNQWNSTFYPQAGGASNPTDPAVIAALRMRQLNAQNATNQNAIAPTAFPPAGFGF